MNLRKLYYETVVKIFDEDIQFNALYDQLLVDLNDDQKRLFINLVNNFFRHFRFVETIFIEEIEKKIDSEKYLIVMLLLAAGTEWLYLDSSKDYAIVNEYVSIAKKRFGQHRAGFVNAVLRKFTELDRERLLADERDLYLSHPEWFIDEMKSSYTPKIAKEILRFNQEVPPLFIRHNKTKTTVKQLLPILKEYGIEAKRVKQFPDFLQILSGNLFNPELFDRGLYYIQSPSHAIPVQLLDPKKNETILDLCAAPGGKSTYIQELTFNKAKLYLNDINTRKKVKIKQNFKRLGVSFSKLTFQEGEKFKLFMDFDKILLDVPCSGSGNLGKHPEGRWSKDEVDIEELTKLQYKILKNCSFYLKNGGAIIYSTCSLLDRENIDIVETFVEHNPDFVIERPDSKFDSFRYKDNYLVANPGLHRLDGGFCCLIRRVR